MILTFKLLNGMVDIDTENLVPRHGHTTGTRSHNKQISCGISKTKQRQGYFTKRIAFPWNTLSTKTVNCNTLEAFKGNYDKERLGVYLK